MPLSLSPTCPLGKARSRDCEDVPSTGPWGQAEGSSEPSLVLERCLEKEGKAVCTAACPCASPLPVCGAGGRLCARCLRCLFEGGCPAAGDKARQLQRDPLASHRMGWGHGGGLQDTSRIRYSLLAAAVPLPSSRPWHGAACLPGCSARLPLHLPRGPAIARKNHPEPEREPQRWARAARCLAVSNKPSGSPLRALAMPPAGGAGGVGDANRGAVPGAGVVWVPGVGCLMAESSRPPRLPAGTCEPVFCHWRWRRSLRVSFAHQAGGWVSARPAGGRRDEQG